MHLDCLFVREPARGRGVGAALLHAVFAIATAQEIAELQWQTPDWNEPAIRFYRRLGAQGKAKLRFTLQLNKN
jgi:GNAT superfamily N-acetyltransferase